jgi:rhodanese-related sulfurtransferase
MAKHAEETRAEKAPAQGAVDFFRAKLAYETSPWEMNETLKSSPDGVVLVDVRDEQQFGEGHIKGAKNVPLGKLPGSLASLPKDKDIVTYCGSITCALSSKAALELAQKGYRVRHMVGGFKSWQEMGFDVEKTA